MAEILNPMMIVPVLGLFLILIMALWSVANWIDNKFGA